MKYAKPKGTFDVFPDALNADERWNRSELWQHVEETMRNLAHEYGFREIRTPIFERTELFERSVGKSSDIVTKEMYTFKDKGDRSMTLRPEGTASAMRAFIERGIHQSAPYHKFFYIGPMFRYERPQAGRYRQHHQFGAEAVGSDSPLQDLEMIDMVCELYRRLGLTELTVMLNTIGSSACREKYRDALRSYFEPHLDTLSADSKVRFEKNVMRILDSKDTADQSLIEKAPSIHDFIDEESTEHFEVVRRGLDKLGHRYVLAPRLVRGLDYYNRTVFEIVSGDLGAQNSVGGGGRYDTLISQLDGPDTPAVGFSSGIERIMQTMMRQGAADVEKHGPQLFFIPMGKEALHYCFNTVSALRKKRIAAETPFKEMKFKQAFKHAENVNAQNCIVIGDDELKSGQALVKNMKTREQKAVRLENLVDEYGTK